MRVDFFFFNEELGVGKVKIPSHFCFFFLHFVAKNNLGV